ncbi:hypothetical protein EB796_021173 [Bugula neritina]|uniref:Uncharacterized protein n=1 Tax=Bugula neritina TaxID=10212 RepID=A0A7J7J4C8_BUGNE|nr:hypothetical protein EB796_021173 [Bugula neritina]
MTYSTSSLSGHSKTSRVPTYRALRQCYCIIKTTQYIKKILVYAEVSINVSCKMSKPYITCIDPPVHNHCLSQSKVCVLNCYSPPLFIQNIVITDYKRQIICW